jgi:predicted RNA-binding Zn ribbon-like protein
VRLHRRSPRHAPSVTASTTGVAFRLGTTTRQPASCLTRIPSRIDVRWPSHPPFAVLTVSIHLRVDDSRRQPANYPLMVGVVASLELPSSLGGRLCLDFVNTIDPREPAGHDFLPDYAHLLAWAIETDVLDDEQLRQVRAALDLRPKQAATAHVAAIELRETLYRVLRAAAERRPPSRRDADTLAARAAYLQTLRRLVSYGVNWRWEWVQDDPLRLPYLVVLDDAVDVLTGDDVYRLGVCAGEACGWLFFDATKNHSRRWCSMAGCGNRAKTRRHYQRQRRNRSRSNPRGVRRHV